MEQTEVIVRYTGAAAQIKSRRQETSAHTASGILCTATCDYVNSGDHYCI
jgi:hypothetical protein